MSLAPAARAGAQDTPVGVRPYRFTVEGLIAQSYINDDLVGADRNGYGGFGVRVMFNRSTPANVIRNFLQRASVGAFAVYTAGQGPADVSTTHIGVQGDVSLLGGAAYRGALDPFVSLGVGGFRTAGRGFSSTNLAVTPAVGTRLSLLQGFGIRGDLRLPIVFADRATANGVAEGGVFLSF